MNPTRQFCQRRLRTSALLTGCVAALLVALAACAPAPATPTAPPATPVSYAIPTPDGLPGDAIIPPLALQPFTLPASTGETVSLNDLTATGRWTMLFFGYTHCPDFCPTTLAEFTQVKRLLGGGADQTQFVFVSVDGERDTPNVLATYLANFDPAFLGLQGDDATLAEIGPDFGLVYQRQTDTGSAASYLVDHTTRSYLIDPQGRLRRSFSYSTQPDAIAQAITALQAAGA